MNIPQYIDQHFLGFRISIYISNIIITMQANGKVRNFQYQIEEMYNFGHKTS